MIEIIAPEGPLCVGVEYDLEALGADNCSLLEWIAVITPPGVDPDEVVFTSPDNIITKVIVPSEGDYSFSVDCGEI